MDIKNINQTNNNLSNTTSSLSSSNVRSTQLVSTNIDDNAVKVQINNIGQKENALSTTLKSLTNGIGVSKIAQNALLKQEEILVNVNRVFRNQNLNNLNKDEQNSIRKEVVLALQNFNEIANNTKYQNKNLLNQDNHYINISTTNSSFSIELPNTTKISDELITSFRATSLNDEESILRLSNDFLNQSINISNVAKELKAIENSLQNVAKSSIEEQISIYNSLYSNNLNFQKETSDFSKSNITSQQGYLVSSQANTNQFQSVMLLS